MATQEDYQLAYSPIYDLLDDKINLWFNDMSQAYGAAGGVNTPLMGRTQLNINKMFSVPQLKALGHSNDGTVASTITTLDDSNTEAYMQSRGVDPGLTIQSSTQNIAGGISLFYLAEALVTTTYMTTLGAVQTWNIAGTEETIAPGGIAIEEETVSGNVKITVTMTGGSAPLVFDNPDRNFVVNIYDGISYNVYSIYSSSWGGEEEYLDFFFGSYVLEYDVIDDSMITVLNNTFGFRQKEIQDSIDAIENGGPNVQNMWLCYAMPYEIMSAHFPELAERVLAVYSSGVVGFTVDGVDIAYYNGVNGVLPSLGIGERGYTEVANPNNPEETNTVPLMIPLNFVADMTVSERYRLKRYALCFITTIQTVTKLKWWETKVFIAIAWAVAIVMAMYGMPQLLALMFKGTVVGQVVHLASLHSQELAIIAGIVAGVLLASPGTFTMTLSTNTLSMIANYANQGMKLYFVHQQEGMMDEMKDIQDGIRETEAMIREQKGRNLYMGIGEQIDGLFSSVYEDMYSIYTVWYDNQTKPVLPPTTVNGII